MSTEPNTLLVKRLTDTAKLPVRGSIHAAGLDLFADASVSIMPHRNNLIPTGISVVIPHGYYGRIAPRSGVSFKTGVMINAGVIDSDYRGELKILMQNPTPDYVDFKQGEKVAQLVIEKIALLEVKEVETLDNTERGANGFGSTGK